jgi:hypothetical protein
MSEAVTCKKCQRWYVPGEEPDPCLGLLPGVLGACCGHGNPSVAYMTWENGVVIRPFTVERDCRIYRPPTRPEL